MRAVKVTKEAFDTFLFPQVARSGSDGNGDAEAGLRLIRKLKDPKVTELVPLTEAEKKAEEEGQKVFPFRRLTVPETTLALQDDEWKFLKSVLAQHRKSVALLALEEFEELRQAVEKAEEIPDAISADTAK